MVSFFNRKSTPERKPGSPNIHVFGGQREESPSSSGSDESNTFKEMGGVRFLPITLEGVDAVSRVIFEKIINDQIRLAPHLYSRIAVGLVASNAKTCLLFADRSKVSADDLRAVVSLLRNQGYSFPSDGVQGYFADSSVVMALSQGHITARSLRKQREISNDPHKNSLFSTFVDIVSWAFVNNADDLDFVLDLTSPNSRVSFKIGGRYLHPARFVMPTDTMSQILGMAWQRSEGGSSANFESSVEQQAKVEIELPRASGINAGTRVRLRWQGSPYDKGVVVTMRLQRLGAGANILSLGDAGYLPNQLAIFKRCMMSEGGLTVFSGVVGSGKSTSLAANLRMLPDDVKKISIEDPVELEIPGMYQKTISRDLSSTDDDPAMVAATRAIFRSALDVFYLGEIRDKLTGLLARAVVESGHSVYTTIHARSALGIIERLASPAIGVPRDVLSAPGILKLLIYQLLLPKVCPHCSLSVHDHAHANHLSGHDLDKHNTYFDRFERLYKVSRSKLRMRNPEGCSYCRKADLPELNGLAGRTVVAEMVELDSLMLDCIARGDAIGLYRHWRSLASESYEDMNLTGKTAMECAVLKASMGIVDPREIEGRFMSFETVEIQRQQEARIQKEKHRMVGAN